MLFLSFGVVLVKSNPPIFCCVVNGIILGGFGLLSALPRVLEPRIMLFLSLGVISNVSNPPPSFYIVLLMVLNLLVVFFMFSKFPWCCSSPLAPL